VSVLSVLAAVTLSILALVQGPGWGWTSVPVLALAVGAAGAIGLTVRRILRHPHAVIEASLFRSREFSSAVAALFLYYVSFAAFLLITVLFLQTLWHYDALQTGLAIAPGPATAALFAVNAGRITGRFGRTVPAVVGPLATVAAALFWLSQASPHPAYASTFLPGMILGGMGAGLTQAPLFAAASTLASHRTTTGSAVLNMARQVGSAVGVALLVVLLAGRHPGSVAPFQRGWILILAASMAAALSLILTRTGAARALGLSAAGLRRRVAPGQSAPAAPPVAR
jgi:hypothetical protein